MQTNETSTTIYERYSLIIMQFQSFAEQFDILSMVQNQIKFSMIINYQLIKLSEFKNQLSIPLK